MSDIHRLIYVSAARQDVTQHMLDEILAAARDNNSKVGVTGLLLYHDGSFFQILEGAKDHVTNIFARIERDQRHARVLTMQSKSVTGRAFPSWSMGYVRSRDLPPHLKESLIDLRSLIGAPERPSFSKSPSVSVHIDAFLSSFREFAEV